MRRIGGHDFPQCRHRGFFGLEPSTTALPDMIEVFETRCQVLVKADKAIDYFGADYKMQVPEHMREDRVDHFFYDKSPCSGVT
jgi:hypothetical protein